MLRFYCRIDPHQYHVPTLAMLFSAIVSSCLNIQWFARRQGGATLIPKERDCLGTNFLRLQGNSTSFETQLSLTRAFCEMTHSLRTSRTGSSLLRKIADSTNRFLTNGIGTSLERGICQSCLRDLRSRHASTATAAVSNPDPVPISQHDPPVIESTAPHQAYIIKAGIVLSRPPLITRDLTPFEKAYFLYQRRLNERLALPFTRYFYYQKNTPADLHWKNTIKERLSASRDIGRYSAHGKEAWNDELLVGAKESEPEEQVEALLKDAVIEEDEDVEDGSASGPKKEKEQIERPQPKVTDADRKNDVRSLNRALARTLYLVVKGSGRSWQFPSGGLVGRESLHRVSNTSLVCYEES